MFIAKSYIADFIEFFYKIERRNNKEKKNSLINKFNCSLIIFYYFKNN